MDLNEHGFLEELLALRRDSWDTNIPTEMNEFFPSDFNSNSFEENPDMSFANSFCEGFSSPVDQQYYNFNNAFNNEVYEFSAPQFTDSSYNTAPFPVREEYNLSVLEDEGMFGDDIQNLQEELCKLEPVQSPEVPPADFNCGTFSERRVRGKKLEGQPSKNLMAERRRRKRLNDRLSMLRSIVPKISKMDRTSILADTIDYTKELLERINKLQQEIESGSDQVKMVDIFKDMNSSENAVRNSPKFKVERKNAETQIEICCAGKPGLLLSTVTTLEALGLEIEQCVISCFNDFAMQASCPEDLDQRSDMSADDIKEALFRNAGYGGRCL